MARKSWYENDFCKGLGIVCLLLVIGWAAVFAANTRAERLNQLYGTNFDAYDIIVGNHKYVRDVRIHQ